MGSGSGNYKPLLITLAILFLLAFIFTFVTQSFETTIPEPTGALGLAVDFVRYSQNFSVSVPLLPDIRPFDLFGSFGDTMANFIVGNVTAMSLIPTEILLPLLILGIISITYGIVKLVLP